MRRAGGENIFSTYFSLSYKERRKKVFDNDQRETGPLWVAVMYVLG